MKKILLLGGSTQQISAIEYANKEGYYTVLCDYLYDNPGQYHARKFYCISTTDKEAVLKVAVKEKVEGIVAYASDPAAPTAAYVAEKLGLPSNPYKSVETLAFKDKFRNFLRENGLNCPKAMSFSSIEEAKQKIVTFKFPVMVKPIDSSGSKGVGKVHSLDDFESAVLSALDNSRAKHIIVEEFIEQDHEYMIGGDCFVINGKANYWGFLNCHRDSKVNPFVPVGKSYPLLISDERIAKVKKEIQKVMDLLNIKFGAFNLEVMIDKKDNVYLIELGPRNGGNMIPDFLALIHGVDLVGATVEAAMGSGKVHIRQNSGEVYCATYNLHVSRDGIFDSVQYKNGIEDKIIKQVIYKNSGDAIEYFDSANKAIGIVFLKFMSQEELFDFTAKPENWIEVMMK